MNNQIETQQVEQITAVTKSNFRNVQIDAIGVGLANAASPFLPVFLTHLNATSFQVGLLSSMPALTGLLLAIPLGRFLQRQTNIVKWFSIARLFVIGCYAITGIISFFIPEAILVNSILTIWAIATLPQTIVAITFSVVMNAVAGPNRRFELMSRRWSTMGVTTTLVVIGIGQMLDRVIFPLNYQLMFIGLSMGGLISYYFSSHIKLPPAVPPTLAVGKPLKEQFREYKELVFTEKPFISFIVKRFIYMTGTSLAAPLIPLYLVRVVHASDGWISIITTSQTAILVIGYFVWTRLGKKRGSRSVVIWTTLGLSLYPFLLSFTTFPWHIAIISGAAGIFQAGLDLVFFDELMKKVPPEYSAIFIGFAQSIQFLAAIASPLIGTLIADTFSLATGLLVSASLRFLGFLLFLSGKEKTASSTTIV
ncbi:MAG: MFS transporter [Anaerolinea sp.]|nr:MFS transporter [Anaerolinea sp.]